MAKKKRSEEELSTDLLLKEVDDDVRAEKLQQWWTQFGNWIIGGAVAVVLVTVGYELWSSYRQQANETATSALLQAETLHSQGDVDEAVAALDAVKGNNGVALIAKIRQADLLESQGQHDEAMELYKQVMASAQTHPQLAELAALHAGQWDGVNESSPFYGHAQEQKILALYREGQKEEAETRVNKLLLNPSLPISQQNRLQMIKRWVTAEQ